MARGRAPIVGVMGGGQAEAEVQAMAEDLGRGIAERGWLLLNGGRSAGVMEASAKGAHEAGGLTIGILPGSPHDEQVSQHIQVPIHTGMGDARNAINVLSSDVIVACPGGAGTLSEVALALKAGTPVILLGWQDHALPGIEAPQVEIAGSVQEALEALDAHLGHPSPDA